MELSAYPLNVCVNYRVELNPTALFVGGSLVINYYGVFTCSTTSSTDDTVEFTDYGTDASCSTTANTNDATFYPKGETGSEGDFECSGTNSYVVVQAWTVGGKTANDVNGQDACCSDYDTVYGLTTTTFATGVCMNTGDGSYSMGECDADGSGTYPYSDSSCAGTKGSVSGAISSTYCEQTVFDDSLISIANYVLQTECVIDGTAQSIDAYCPYVAPTQDPTTSEPTTPFPSSNPTAPTTGDPTVDPTMDPTADPTEPSSDPTTSPSQEPTTSPIKVDKGAAQFYFVKYLIVLVMGMAAWMN